MVKMSLVARRSLQLPQELQRKQFSPAQENASILTFSHLTVVSAQKNTEYDFQKQPFVEFTSSPHFYQNWCLKMVPCCRSTHIQENRLKPVLNKTS